VAAVLLIEFVSNLSECLDGLAAGLDWVASATGTYRVRVTSFESVNTGELVVTRK